eukprot:1176990-Prorocentrum_minimum.AAC.1
MLIATVHVPQPEQLGDRIGPNGYVSISDWLRCLPWAPVRADVAATSALLFMSRTVTMRDGILYPS